MSNQLKVKGARGSRWDQGRLGKSPVQDWADDDPNGQKQKSPSCGLVMEVARQGRLSDGGLRLTGSKCCEEPIRSLGQVTLSRSFGQKNSGTGYSQVVEGAVIQAR